MPRPGPATSIKRVDWLMPSDEPIRYSATTNQITVSNDEDGALIDTVPLPLRPETRVELARLILAESEYRVARAPYADDTYIAVERDRYKRVTEDRERLGYEIDDLRKQLHDTARRLYDLDRDTATLLVRAAREGEEVETDG